MMTKADKYLVNDIKNILDNGYLDENPRPRYEDGDQRESCDAEI